MTKIELTDEKEISDFQEFCKYKQERLSEHANWKQLRSFVENMQYGAVTLIIKDSLPVKVERPMQSVVFGISLTKL